MSVYDKGNFSGRVNYAAQCFMRGIRSSRHMDTCFEMGDGDAVVAALVRRAAKNPRLHAAIASQWGGTFPQGWIDTAASESLKGGAVVIGHTATQRKGYIK